MMFDYYRNYWKWNTEALKQELERLSGIHKRNCEISTKSVNISERLNAQDTATDMAHAMRLIQDELDKRTPTATTDDAPTGSDGNTPE